MLTDYQNFLTAYRQTCGEACVKVSSLSYGNYMMFYKTYKDNGNFIFVIKKNLIF